MQRVQEQKTRTKFADRDTESYVEEYSTPDTAALKGDLDSILGEIDDVLAEVNAEEFVKQYVQQGGE